MDKYRDFLAQARRRTGADGYIVIGAGLLVPGTSPSVEAWVAKWDGIGPCGLPAPDPAPMPPPPMPMPPLEDEGPRRCRDL